MTRKDFQLIADVVARLDGLTAEQQREIAGDFADALHTANPQFDRSRFLKACGVKEG